VASRADLRNAANRMNAEASVSFRTSVRNAGASGMAQNGSIVDYLGRALAARAIPHGQLRRAHQDAGDQARRSMVAAYTHRPHRRAVPSYRIGDRYAGGALRRALNQPGQVEATPFTLRFINRDILDQEARQWRRLNYGAGGGSEGGITAPAQFPVQWDGLVVATMGLPPDTRPGFTIPQGMFVTPGGERVRPSTARRGQDTFRVGNPNRRFPTAGIASSNFLDGGVRRLVTALPISYLDMYTRLYNNAARSAHITLRVGATMVPPRPFSR
jgi:hypothetical protein